MSSIEGIGGSQAYLGSGASEADAISEQGIEMEGAQNAKSTEAIASQGIDTAIRTIMEMLMKTLKAGLDACKGLI